MPDLLPAHGRGRPDRVNVVLVSYACACLAGGLPWPLLLVLTWQQYGDQPGGALMVGLAGAARMIPYVALSWAAGSLADRMDRGRLVRATLAARTLLLALTAAAVGAGQAGWAVLLAALAVTAGVPAYPAIGAALPALTASGSAAGRSRATEALVTVEVAGWVVGPAIGGLLVAAGAGVWTVATAASLALVALVLMRGVRLPTTRDPDHDDASGTRETLRVVLGTPAAMAALSLAGVLNLVESTTGLLLLPLAHDAWHRGDQGFGVAVACLGFGALAAPLLSRWGRRSVPTLAGLGFLVLVVATTPVPGVALPALVLAGAAGVLVESSVTRTLQRTVPDRCRAGALGLADTVMVAGCLLGTVAAPALAELAGARTALVILAAICLTPVLVGRATTSPTAAYDVARESARPDPRGTPAMGGSRLG